MSEKGQSQEGGAEGTKGTPRIRISRRLSVPPEQQKNIKEVKSEMNAFLAWLALGVSVLAAIFSGLQWTVMAGQQQLADKSARRQLRAYVMPVDGEVDLSKDVKTGKYTYIVHINARNFGQTPAYNVTSAITSILSDPEPIPFLQMGSITQDTTDDSIDLAPTQPWLGNHAESITPEDINEINAGFKVFDVWVLLKYRDTFQWCQYDEMRLRTASGKTFSNGNLALTSIYSNVSDQSDLENNPNKGCEENLDKGSRKAGFPFRRTLRGDGCCLTKPRLRNPRSEIRTPAV